VEGPVRIFDYETFSNIAENFDKLDEFFNSNLSKHELKKRRESYEHRLVLSNPKF
jgi:flagellin-specific chaperone FliS